MESDPDAMLDGHHLQLALERLAILREESNPIEAAAAVDSPDYEALRENALVIAAWIEAFIPVLRESAA